MSDRETGLEIAVIGMAGRFPDAKNTNEFWENLKNGVESIAFSIPGELANAEIGDELLTDPNYVRSKGGVLEGKEWFDAAFFGYTPAEAEIMDPQVRLFHECSWQALEDAGYNPENYEGLIGVYAGANNNLNWQALSVLSGKSDELGLFPSYLLFEKDSLSTRVSYKLKLRGPSIAVQTACSTSLLAIHLASRALLMKECDMALAGGVSVSSQTNTGYLYQEGMILSPDGHCRPFDARAGGTVTGYGVGVVVLKRLRHAAADNDNILAVIKGSAVNNEGGQNLGYTAPSITSQADIIRTALRIARVESETITYVEAHGTGTTLGDPIEIEALKKAFNTNKKGFCGIGSVKSNIGHLDTAAGAAGFIKTVLALKNKQIPPTIHFEKPNLRIDLENSPFYVNSTLKEWVCDKNKYPLRAGVSSFGMGGTNVHVILEQAPIEQSVKHKAHEAWSQGRDGGSPPHQARDYQLILLSARSETALEKLTKNLANYLKENHGNPTNPGDPGLTLADAAYTLQVGRKAFKYRRKLVCSTAADAHQQLSSPGSSSRQVQTFYCKEENRPIIFMFPGLGAQYVNMGWGLYQTESVFRQEMDRCFEILKPLLDYDIKEILYPGISVSNVSKVSGVSEESSPAANKSSNANMSYTSSMSNINQPEIAPVVIFIFEYALAKLLMKWGIKPHAMIGYSLGEYAAACLSGVFSIEDAIGLVVHRGKLIRELPAGGMLSVPLPVKELKPLLNNRLSIAIDNGPSCIAAGPEAEIEAFEKSMKERRLICLRLPTRQAIHSHMMEPVLESFTGKVRQVKLNKPGIPYISNVTGNWISIRQAADPGYWAAHLRATVQFAKGINRLRKESHSIFIEIGPGGDLSTLVERCIRENPHQQVIKLMGKPQQDIDDGYYFLNRIGQLWLYGVNIDWSGFYHGKTRRRISLPVYPFEGQRCWIEGDPFKMGVGARDQWKQSRLQKKKDIVDWFYIPTWKVSSQSCFTTGERLETPNWLMFVEESRLCSLLAKRLKQEGHEIIIVNKGRRFSQDNACEYTINPGRMKDYQILFKQLKQSGKYPRAIVHLWSVTNSSSQEKSKVEQVNAVLETGFFSLLFLAKTIGQDNVSDEIRLVVISSQIHEITGEEMLCPGKATLLGPVKVIPQEYPYMTCRSLDVVLPEPGSLRESRLIDQLYKEITTKSPETVVAYRGNYRWVRRFEPLRPEECVGKTPRLRKGGVYLVTGGHGNIGFILAKHLAQQVRAKLVLVGRSPLPAREKWNQWLNTHDKNHPTSRKIQNIRELEKWGARVLVCNVDVANREKMQTALSKAEKHFGPINGIIHAAGVNKGNSIRTIQEIEETQCREQFKSKIFGLLALAEVFQGKTLDFCLLTSSLASILGGLRFVAYAAANLFMDAFVYQYNRHVSVRWVSINWADWLTEGVKRPTSALGAIGIELGMTQQEGIKTFQRILSVPEINQVTVSTGDLQARIENWVKLESLEYRDHPDKDNPTERYARPDLIIPFIPPRSRIEQTIALIWQKFLGIEQVGTRDNFFELGGDSLKAITVISRIHKTMKTKIPLVEFFNHPTIERIAAYIESSGESIYSSIEPVEKKGHYVLSSPQKRLYIMTRIQDTGYIVSELMKLEGNTDRQRLEETFKKLITRHESLRTSFEMIKGVVFQKIHDEVEFGLLYYETNPKEVQGIIRSFIVPFNMKRAPLFRVGLIKINTQKHILILEMHHIISDGISMGILVRDFIALYKGEILPQLKLQYKDYAEWQHRLIQSKHLKKQEEYWISRFKDDMPVFNLPLDFERPGVKNFAGEAVSIEVEEELGKKLAELVRHTDKTLYMVLLAVFNILLFFYSGQELVVVGSTVSGRGYAELKDIIGMFVNMVVMKNRLNPDMTFKEFLQEVKINALEAFENQDYQYEELVNKLNIKRQINRNPLFDVVFVVQTLDGPDMEINDLKLIPYPGRKEFERFDITHFALETPDKLTILLRYSTQLYRHETIKKMGEHYIEIMKQVVENINITIKEIEVSGRAALASKIKEENRDFNF